MRLPRLIRARLFASVPVNGVLVAFKDVPLAVQRFCVPAYLYNAGEPDFDVSKSGSAFLLRYRECNFALCCRHQIAAFDADQFSIMLQQPNGRFIGLPPDAIGEAQAQPPHQANLDDIALFEYRSPRNGRELRRHFLQIDLATTREDLDAGSIIASAAIGYPTSAVEYSDPLEGGGVNIRVGWLRLYLTDAAPALMDEENRLPMVQDPLALQRPLDRPDGMSGAPVFCVWRSEDWQCHLSFLGMITSARNGRFMIYSARHIRRALDEYIAL